MANNLPRLFHYRESTAANKRQGQGYQGQIEGLG
jgi:hypothetical protein